MESDLTITIVHSSSPLSWSQTAYQPAETSRKKASSDGQTPGMMFCTAEQYGRIRQNTRIPSFGALLPSKSEQIHETIVEILVRERLRLAESNKAYLVRR